MKEIKKISEQEYVRILKQRTQQQVLRWIKLDLDLRLHYVQCLEEQKTIVNMCWWYADHGFSAQQVVLILLEQFVQVEHVDVCELPLEYTI